MARKNEVCLLYSTEDKAVASKLENALNYYSIDIWNTQNIAIGNQIVAETEKTLKQAKFIIVLWSNKSVNSAFIKELASNAKEQRKKLIPVLIENVNVPSQFIDIQPASLIGWNGDKESEQIVKLWRLIQDNVLKFRRRTVKFNQFMGLITLLVSIIGLLFTVATPEVRCFLKLQCQDKALNEGTKTNESIPTPTQITETPQSNIPTSITPSIPTQTIEASQTKAPISTPSPTLINIPAKPANQAKLVQVDDQAGLKSELQECKRVNSKTVICDVLNTNQKGENQLVSFHGVYKYSGLIGTNSTAIDISGSVHYAKLVKIGDVENTLNVEIPLIPGVPTKVSFTFEVPLEVTKLAAVEISYYPYNIKQYQKLAFRNINITN